MFAFSKTRRPSLVSAASSLVFRDSFSLLLCLVFCLSHFSSSFCSGFIKTSPASAFKTRVSPLLISVVADDRPSTAGISKALARIAVWEVFPPMSMTIPFTCSRFIVSTSEGKRSWAVRITSLSNSARETLFIENSLLKTRRETSSISDALSLKTGSGEESIFCIIILEVS